MTDETRPDLEAIDEGEIRDELPADLDPSQVTAPYLFPNNSRRKIPAVLYTLIGVGCLVLWQTAGDDAVLEGHREPVGEPGCGDEDRDTDTGRHACHGAPPVPGHQRPELGNG